MTKDDCGMDAKGLRAFCKAYGALEIPTCDEAGRIIKELGMDRCGEFKARGPIPCVERSKFSTRVFQVSYRSHGRDGTLHHILTIYLPFSALQQLASASRRLGVAFVVLPPGKGGSICDSDCEEDGPLESDSSDSEACDRASAKDRGSVSTNKEALRVISPSSHDGSRKGIAIKNAAAAHQPQASLQRLPRELIDMVYDMLSVRSTIAMSKTCSRLREIFLDRDDQIVMLQIHHKPDEEPILFSLDPFDVIRDQSLLTSDRHVVASVDVSDNVDHANNPTKQYLTIAVSVKSLQSLIESLRIASPSTAALRIMRPSTSQKVNQEVVDILLKVLHCPQSVETIKTSDHMLLWMLQNAHSRDESYLPDLEGLLREMLSRGSSYARTAYIFWNATKDLTTPLIIDSWPKCFSHTSIWIWISVAKWAIDNQRLPTLDWLMKGNVPNLDAHMRTARRKRDNGIWFRSPPEARLSIFFQQIVEHQLEVAMRSPEISRHGIQRISLAITGAKCLPVLFGVREATFEDTDPDVDELCTKIRKSKTYRKHETELQRHLARMMKSSARLYKFLPFGASLYTKPGSVSLTCSSMPKDASEGLKRLCKPPQVLLRRRHHDLEAN